MRHLDTAKNPEFWAAVRTDCRYQPLIDSIKEHYAHNYSPDLPSLKYSIRWKYYKDGDRNTFSVAYKRRRLYLASAAILSLLYPEETHYLEETQDIIWSTCDEYSWAKAAHAKGDFSTDVDCIDLFNAHTGFILCEILDILGDRLEKPIHERVAYEVRRRIIQSYNANTFPWEQSHFNWAAVCSCCVAGCLLYLEPELFKTHLPRLRKCMEGYLEGFAPDGVCIEGMDYWSYGFGHFVYFLDMLDAFTQEPDPLWDDPHVKTVARFAQANFLAGNDSVSFSDCSRQVRLDIGLQHFLHKKFPDSVALVPNEITCLRPTNVGFTYFLRSFLFFDPSKSPAAIPLQDHYYPYSQQLMINRPSYSLAIKASNNGTPHNHNDVGTFIFADKNGQALCDVGPGVYAKDYYKSFCVSSLSHNVPIIDGAPQARGREYYGTMTYENNTVVIDMTHAYDSSTLESLIRSVTVCENGITLTDTFRGDCAVTERFVSLRKPEIKNNCISIGNTMLIPESQHYTFKIQEEYIAARESAEKNTLVYCMDFQMDPSCKTFTMQITAKG